MKQGEEGVLLILKAESASKTRVQIVYWESIPGTRGKWAQGLKEGSNESQYPAVSQRNFYLRIRMWRSIYWSSSMPPWCRVAPVAMSSTSPHSKLGLHLPWIGFHQHPIVQCQRSLERFLVHAWDKVLSVPDKLKPTENLFARVMPRIKDEAKKIQ